MPRLAVAVSMADLDVLYADHWHWLKHWLERRTRCVTLAEDLAQDTFCRLLDQRSATALHDVRSYLATVARRILIDDLRRRKVESAIHASLHADPLADCMSPERILAATQLLELIMKVLDRLSPQARDAFLLRRLDGLEQREIAVRLGISLSTVKRHIARAYAECYAAALD